MISNITTNGPPTSNSHHQWSSHIKLNEPHMNTSLSFLSTSNPPAFPIVLTPRKGFLSVQPFSLIALTHFPLYFTAQGQSPIGSSGSRNGFLCCHPHAQAFA